VRWGDGEVAEAASVAAFWMIDGERWSTKNWEVLLHLSTGEGVEVWTHSRGGTAHGGAHR
jgi:hypothetical protein